jgi:hypothetical protein
MKLGARPMPLAMREVALVGDPNQRRHPGGYGRGDDKALPSEPRPGLAAADDERSRENVALLRVRVPIDDMISAHVCERLNVEGTPEGAIRLVGAKLSRSCPRSPGRPVDDAGGNDFPTGS